MDGRARHLDAGAPPGSDRAAYRDVDSLLRDRAARDADRVYLACVDPPGRLTFGELDGLTRRLARWLADRGLGAGDRVSLVGGNTPAWVVAYFGVQRYGATVNPVNVEVSGPALAAVLRDVAPRLILHDRALPAEAAGAVRAAGAETLVLDDLLAALAGSPDAADLPRVGGPEDIALLDFTSGTTATPKGVAISHRAAFYMARSLVERLSLSEADRLLEYRSLAWASPQCLSLGPSLQAGARLVLAPRFSRRAFLGWIRDHAVTVAAGVPTVFAMLLEEPVAVPAGGLPTLRFATSSAAPLAAATQAAFERRYGIRILQGCGMTEAGFIAINPPQAPRAGSVGPPVPYLDVRVVDEQGGACPPGVEGELVVGGRAMASGYLADRGRLSPIPADGFPTGDLARRDPDGYLVLTGRRKELIIRGGVNIAPMEITAVLLAHPAVAEAVTLGVPDPVYGEAVASFVVLRDGAAAGPAELLAHCRARLSEFKCPRQVRVVAALPRTERGKVAREALRALWAAGRG